MDLSDWMADLDEETRSRPIIFLAIPGSHDSLSYSIRPDSQISPDAEPIVKQMEEILGCVVRKVMYRWCVTQKYSVVEQLKSGIRYFDLRVSLKPNDEGFYFVHGMYGDRINDALSEIVAFLKKHEKEVVILDFQHFYAFTPEDHIRLKKLLKDTFGPMMCPLPKDITMVTLSWMFEEGYRVIIIYRDKGFDDGGALWPSKRWPTPWPDTMCSSTLLDFLDMSLAKRPMNSGFVSQCILTPTKYTVVRFMFSGLKRKCAGPAASVTLPWIESRPPGCLNIAISDFIEDNDFAFPRAVLAANRKSGSELEGVVIS